MKTCKRLLSTLVLTVMVVVSVTIPVLAEDLAELFANGTFNTNINGWGKTTSTQGTLTHLENGGYNGTGGLAIAQTTAGTETMANCSRLTTIEEGKAYRLTFWYKADADVNNYPFVRLSHLYGANYLTVDHGIASKGYRLDSGTRVYDTSYAATACEKDTWTHYTYYFNVPVSPDVAKVYGGTQVNIGVAGYGGDVTAKTVATGIFDDVSLVEDVSGVKYYNTAGVELQTMPAAGQKVKALYHIGAAGSNSDISTLCAFTGLYKTQAGIQTLKNTSFSNVTNGTLNTKTVSSLNFDFIKQPADFEVEFEVPSDGTYSLATFFWDSINSMKPLASKSGLN